jgi:GNAT superfamily N-acetyltransferase
MSIEFRTAKDVDIQAMAVIRAQVWGTEAYWQDRIAGYLRGEINPQKALPARASFVAVGSGRVIGFVAGHRTRRFDCDGELEWVNVDEAWRGRGIAARLMAMMGAWFVEQHAQRICVNVDPNNSAARRLYATHGAAPLNEFWMVWEDAGLMRHIEDEHCR